MDPECGVDGLKDPSNAKILPAYTGQELSTYLTTVNLTSTEYTSYEVTLPTE